MKMIKNIFIFLLAALIGLPFFAHAEPISVVAVGDLLLGGSATETVNKKGFAYPFQETTDLIRQADIAMANLEAPLTDRGEKHPEKKYTFRVPPAAASQIKQTGFDLMTLANNHIGDYGVQGVLDTLETLTKTDLGISGAGHNLKEARTPFIADINGSKLAFLSYSNTFPKSFYARKDKPGTAPGYFDYVRRDISKASKQYDYVIVSFHWGGERLHEPKDYQKELGRAAIDSGAHVVIGHHPHVLQGAERYKDGVIYYSLGNYAFGSYSQAAVTAGMARVWLDNGELIKAEILPLNVFNIDVHFQPRPLTDEPADAFAREFNKFSQAFDTRLKKQTGLFWQIEKIETTEELGHQDAKVTMKGENSL